MKKERKRSLTLTTRPERVSPGDSDASSCAKLDRLLPTTALGILVDVDVCFTFLGDAIVEPTNDEADFVSVFDAGVPLPLPLPLTEVVFVMTLPPTPPPATTAAPELLLFSEVDPPLLEVDETAAAPDAVWLAAWRPKANPRDELSTSAGFS